MENFWRAFWKLPPVKGAKWQRGFTLVELLVVIGIIVALAGVTVPLVTKFTGSGKTGAMAAERETVQTAMAAMMAEQDITTVTAVINPAAATNTWTALPAGTGAAVLFGGAGAQFLKKGTTSYYYCWTASGEVYSRDAAPEAADDAGACRTPP
ncbi:MAG: type II secretion system protein [Chloroflexi bacterium]|nr:type II secretion system protein [Chloroflexota bacterium]